MPHLGPSFPAEATTKMPADRSALTAGRRELGSQPSRSSGQPHELFNTWADRVGSPSVKGSPSRGKGANMNCIQSRYLAGFPRLRARLAQAYHCASGASPTVSPKILPKVWVPCPPESSGCPEANQGSNQL